MRRYLVFLIAFLAVLAGCGTPGQRPVVGTTYQPVVDTRGVDLNRYYADLNSCTQYAAQVDQGSNAAAGAVGGALIGATLGSIFGHGNAAGRGALAGAVAGGVGGGLSAAETQRDILRRCMAGRGYRVLY